MNAIPRLRPYAGPALFSAGFRPFFFFGACYAALAVALWIPLWEGEIALPTAFTPRDWHVHEMLFGFLAAIVTGFLLTAIPNWTGRLPLQGTPLMVLAAAWAAGRAAVLFSSSLGGLVAAVIDATFLLLVVAAAAREIVAGSNWRNLPVILPVTVLFAANVAFHAEAHLSGVAEYSGRAAIGAVVTLIMLIGGRIIPSFTRNWLARRGPGRMPVPFGKPDAAALGLSAAALVLWTVIPEGSMTGLAMAAAGVLQLVRLARWAGERTLADRLVLILHVGYAFVPLGFFLTALSSVGVVPASAGMHAWMAGAAGSMTLAVMTRASLGHSGRQLVASAGIQAIYAAVVLAGLARIAAALLPEWGFALLHVAALGWIGAFGGFALLFAPILFRARKS